MKNVRKAIYGALVGTLAWATAVVESASANITASEWIMLAGVGVANVTVFLVPNEGA